MARRGRGLTRASSRAVASKKSPLPQDEQSDTEMQDVQSDRATPQDDLPDDQEEEDGLEDGEDGVVSTPAADSDEPTRLRARPSSLLPQKRRAGRPPKTRPHDWDASDLDSKGTSETNTPKRRGGFRGGRGFGGGRWKNRGGPSHISQVPLDKEGNMATVRDDEVEIPEDPEGETKVDKSGYLKDGREYRVRTFTVAGKGDKLYMLSTEPARCIGFRDSYLFFQKHRTLFKIILSDEAKKDLIERNLIPHSYKGRAIGVVTARSVYREFGARIVIGGKKITDDYHVAAARANGDVEGETAVPDDQLPASGEVYDRNRYVAWHGASSVYHSSTPTVPMQNGKVELKKRKVHVTGSNWMLEHAREASRFNSTIANVRRQNLEGVYELHTNNIHYPEIMQPTHARWEQIPPDDEQPPVANGHNLTNGTSTDENSSMDNRFPPISSYQYRNLVTADSYTRGPPISGLGIPGPGVNDINVAPLSLTDVSEDVMNCLPPDCLEAFLAAREQEVQWKRSWGTEAEDGARATPKITYSQAV